MFKMRRRWLLHTHARHFPDMQFQPQPFWSRRAALSAARAYRAMLSFQLFTYELEDTRTGERTPA